MLSESLVCECKRSKAFNVCHKFSSILRPHEQVCAQTTKIKSSLNCSQIREVLGRVRVHAIWEPFLWSSSFCQRGCPRINWPSRSSIELCPEFFHYLVKSCCLVAIWSWFLTLQNNHNGMFPDWCLSIFLSRRWIEMGDSVTTGFGLGFGFGCLSFSRRFFHFSNQVWLTVLCFCVFWLLSFIVFLAAVFGSDRLKPKRLTC